MQKGVQNDVVVMDFAKAFDKLAHNRLLFKLLLMGSRVILWEREMRSNTYILYIKKKPILHKYTLHGHTLSSVPQIKYLGVHISNDLKWNSHTNSISSKANQTLGFLKRNLKINSPTIKEKAYKSIVRPKLEYCNTVWDPKSIKIPKKAKNQTIS